MTNIDISGILVITDSCPDLEEIVHQYGQEFSERGFTYEIVLVLDGLSPDLTDQIRERVPRDGIQKLVQLNQSFGVEKALATGLMESEGRFLVSLPSYMQLDPGDVHLVLDALVTDFDLVVGWRVPRVDPLVNRIQSWIFNRLMSTLTGVRLHDMNSGLLAMQREVVREVMVEGNVSRFLPVLAHRRGYRVGEVHVRHLRERGRTGFFGVGVYVRRVLDVVGLVFITRFTRKPLRFFGAMGGVCALCGLLVLGYLGLDYLYKWSVEGDLANRASLVIGAMLFMLGVMIFSLGLVAEIIIFTNARQVQEYTIDEELGGEGPVISTAIGDGTRPDEAGDNDSAERSPET